MSFKKGVAGGGGGQGGGGGGGGAGAGVSTGRGLDGIVNVNSFSVVGELVALPFRRLVTIIIQN